MVCLAEEHVGECLSGEHVGVVCLDGERVGVVCLDRECVGVVCLDGESVAVVCLSGEHSDGGDPTSITKTSFSFACIMTWHTQCHTCTSQLTIICTCSVTTSIGT